MFLFMTGLLWVRILNNWVRFCCSSYGLLSLCSQTLLEMVGGPGSKKYLIGDRTGASYGKILYPVQFWQTYLMKKKLVIHFLSLLQGNELWKYIQNSVSDPKKPSQLERYASYSLDLYFQVTKTTTTKMIYTGDNGVSLFYFTVGREHMTSDTQAFFLLMVLGQYTETLECYLANGWRSHSRPGIPVSKTLQKEWVKLH